MKSVRSIAIVLLGAVALTLSLAGLGWIGHAHAQAAGAAGPDPTSLAVQLYQFVRDGQNLPAVGVALMLIVYGLRTGASKLPVVGKWFTTTLGGYVLGFGAAGLAFIGPALASGQPITLPLVGQALGTAFAASGKWEGLRDLITKLRGGKPAIAAPVKAVLVLLVGGLIFSQSSCKGWTSSKPVQDVVVCAEQDQAALTTLETKCAVQIPNWGAVGACVVADLGSSGWQVGSCVLADLAQQYLAKPGGASGSAAVTAHQVLEDYRAKHGHGATIRTKYGDE